VSVGETAISAIPYGQYLIMLVKLAADQWRSDIRRLDGRKIKTIGGGEFDFIPGKAKFSAEEAVAEAKRLINAGGMS
jgi:hypothetical protein